MTNEPFGTSTHGQFGTEMWFTLFFRLIQISTEILPVLIHLCKMAVID